MLAVIPVVRAILIGNVASKASEVLSRKTTNVSHRCVLCGAMLMVYSFYDSDYDAEVFEIIEKGKTMLRNVSSSAIAQHLFFRKDYLSLQNINWERELHQILAL